MNEKLFLCINIKIPLLKDQLKYRRPYTVFPRIVVHLRNRGSGKRTKSESIFTSKKSDRFVDKCMSLNFATNLISFSHKNGHFSAYNMHHYAGKYGRNSISHLSTAFSPENSSKFGT